MPTKFSSNLCMRSWKKRRDRAPIRLSTPPHSFTFPTLRTATPLTPLARSLSSVAITWSTMVSPRIFRYATGVTLTADAVKQRTANLVISSRLLLVHHFQYRSAEQTQHRINIRTQNNTHSNNWGHVNSLHWQDYVVPHQHLHRFDGEIRYGLPAKVPISTRSRTTRPTPWPT
jgi:hypothetical protein